MPKIKIEIELKDLDYCNGCPCCWIDSFTDGFNCGNGYEINNNLNPDKVLQPRPKKCKQEKKEVKSNGR
jgi:hypothetical protein